MKGRTFFFAAYEGQRERVGSDFNLFVPTPAEIQLGEQEALANSAIIPNGLNPALVHILQTYLPTTPNADNTLPASVSDKNDNNNFIARIDHQINSVHSLAGRYAFGQDSQIFPLGSLGGFGSGSRLGAFAQRSPTRVQVASASLLSVLNANHVNEVRFGYSRFRNSFGSLDDTVNPSTFGINFGTGKLGLPQFDFNGPIENLGATIFGIARGRISQTYQIPIILRGLEGATRQNSAPNTAGHWLTSRMITLPVDCFRSTRRHRQLLFRVPTRLARLWRITSWATVLPKRRLETPLETFATVASAFSRRMISEFGPTSR